MLEIPLEGRHTAGALRKAQHLFPVTQRVRGVPLAQLGGLAFSNRGAQEHRGTCEHTRKRLQQDEVVMDLEPAQRGPHR